MSDSGMAGKSMMSTMSKKVLITGVTGQDGSYMVDYLLAETNFEIYGMIRRTSKPDLGNLKNSLSNPRFKIVIGDLSDSVSIDNLVNEIKPDYFINLAAQSFVASSWHIPEQTFDVDAMGVIRCLEAIRKHAKDCRFYNAGCHDVETKIVTANGIKDYADVSVGDLVWTLNENTSEIELKPIAKKIDKFFEGKMVKFKGNGKDMLVTTNHNVAHQTRKNKILYKSAIKAREMERFTLPLGKWNGKKNPQIVDLSHLIKEKSFDKNVEITKIESSALFYLIGLYIGDGSCNIIKKENFCFSRKISQNNRNPNGTLKSSKQLEKLDLKKELRFYECPRIIIDIPKTDKSWEKVSNCLNSQFIKWHHHNNIDIYFSSWGLYHWFDKCGHKSWEKRIPKEYLEYDVNLLKQLFEGILDSDGYRGKCITTTSFGLVQDLIELGTKLGKHVYFSKRKYRESTLKDGRVIKPKHQAYDVYIKKNRTHYQKTINTEWFKKDNAAPLVDYKGQIWCLEMKDNRNFLIERNGYVSFSGNSSEEMGDVIISPQTMEHPARARSPYGAAKIAARQLVKVYRESYGLYAIQGLLYNHESERRGEEFVSRKITFGVARIYHAIKNKNFDFQPIELGNLDAKRDWSHAEDFVVGIWKMINQEGQPKEYLLSSNETHSIREFIELAFNAAGIRGVWSNPFGKPEDEKYLLSDDGVLATKRYVPLISVNPKFYRPAEVSLLHGNSTEARKELEWTPKNSFNDLVNRMVKSDIENHKIA